MVNWTDHALTQLRHVHDYIKQDSPLYAKKQAVIESRLPDDLKRLRLRDYQPSDFNPIHQLLNDEEVTQYLFDNRVFSPSDTQQFITQTFCKTTAILGNQILLNKHNHAFIGITGIQKCESFLSNDYEFGFAIKKADWGKGYASEIAWFLIQFAFERMKLNRIIATTHPDNKASLHILQKLGMRELFKLEIKNRGLRVVYVKYNN